MTDSSSIQQARDALAKWRKAATPGPWLLVWMLGRADWPVVISDGIGEVINTRPEDLTIKGDDAALIVGTAGNPDLLDAIDYMLAIEQDSQLTSFAPVMPDLQVQRIAAAILAADGRMSA